MTYDFNLVIDRSSSNCEKYKHRKSLFGTDDVIPMWVADMDIASPSFVLDAIKQRAEHAVLGYEDRPKEAIAAQINWLKRRQNFNVEPEWVLSVHSTVAAMHMSIQAFTEPMDEVVIMTPVYHAFARSVKQENRKLIEWPLESDDSGYYTFSLERLESLISNKTKLLLLCSPHNPVGRVWSKNELESIAKFCLSHNIVMVSDEVHADLTYPPFVFKPLATISETVADNCITLQGPGKTFNLTGIGLASIIISNSKLRNQFKKVYRQFHPSYGNAFAQVAFKSAYENGDIWLDELLVHLHNNQKQLQTLCDKHPHSIAFRPSEATYLAWLNCEGLGLTDKALNTFFIKKAGLGLSAGVVFGLGGEQHMRLNLAVTTQIMQQAIEQLDTAITTKTKQRGNSNYESK